MVSTIRKRDVNDELLWNVRDALKKEVSELERRVRDWEVLLKAAQERVLLLGTVLYFVDSLTVSSGKQQIQKGLLLCKLGITAMLL